MNTDISHDEAQESLDLANDMMARTRKAIASGSASVLLVLLGTIWVVGYVGNHFLARSPASGVLWLVLVVIGVLVSWFVGVRWKSPIKSPISKRIGLFWLLLYVYANVWVYVLSPWRGSTGAELGLQMGAYGATIPMFAYVVMGLWLDSFLIWVGLFVTALTLTGFYLLQPYFYLWMAATGGGTLIGTGLYIRYRWK